MRKKQRDRMQAVARYRADQIAAYAREAARLEELRQRARKALKAEMGAKAVRKLERALEPSKRRPHPIYDSPRWRALRVDVLARSGGRCCLCGRGARDGVILHVDHIKPVSRFPALTWDHTNLQVLCADCNLGKSNRYAEDWR